MLDTRLLTAAEAFLDFVPEDLKNFWSHQEAGYALSGHVYFGHDDFVMHAASGCIAPFMFQALHDVRKQPNMARIRFLLNPGRKIETHSMDK